MAKNKRRKKIMRVKRLSAPPLENGICDASLVVGAEAGNVINVAIQLKDEKGRDLSAIGIVQAYLSDDSAGDGVCTTAPDSDIAVGTDGTILGELVADKIFLLQSEADGDIDLDIGETSTGTWYFCLIIPSSGLLKIATVTFT